MAQYRRAAQSRGYSPRRVDKSNIQRMREDSERTARNMRERAEAEISERRRSLAQQKEDQAATRRMEEKNFQIETQNSQRELEGLRLQAQQQSRQAAIDIEASNKIFQSIANFSDTAMNYALKLEEKKRKEDYDDRVNAAKEANYDNLGLYIADAAATSVQQQAAVTAAEATGGADPLVVSKVKNRDPNQIVRFSLSTIDAALRDGVMLDYLLDGVNRREQAAEGRPLEYEDKRDALFDMAKAIRANFRDTGYPAEIVANVEKRLETTIGSLLKTFRTEQIKVEDNQNRNTNISIFENSSGENLLIQFPAVWSKLQDLNNYDAAESWKDLTPSMTAVDQKTGNPIMDMSVIDQLPLTINGKETTFGEHFTNSKGQAVGIRAKVIEDRNRNELNWRTVRDKVERQANGELEDEFVRAAAASPTTQNIAELQRQYVEATGGEFSQKLTNLSKYASVEAGLRNNRAQELLAKNDENITQADVDAMEVVGTAEQKVAYKNRYENGPGQYRTKEAKTLIDNATAVIKGQTTFGTTKRALTGQQVAISYMEQQIRIRARQYYGDRNNGYTVTEALTKAADDEKQLFEAQKDTKNYTLPYAVKSEPGGGVSFPLLEGRAGNVDAAEREYRDYQKMRSMVKMIGFQEVANVPHSIFSAERLEYILQNSDKPGFKYKTSELGFQGLSAGSPMHDIVNAQLKAAGRSERIGPPPALSGITIPPESQRIVNDGRRSYQAKLNAINVASGNTAVYREPSYMRPGSPLVASAGPNNPTPRQAYDYMLELGVSDTHAKGILANIQGESGFQTGVMGDNGMSGGLFQMYDDRYRKMERAVPNWRANWKGQIKHALQDDRAPEYLQMQFNSPEEAADWFLENYERPAMSHRPGRKELNRSFIPNLGF